MPVDSLHGPPGLVPQCSVPNTELRELMSSRMSTSPEVGHGVPVRSVEQFTPQFTAYTQEYPGGRAFFENLRNARQSRPTVPGYEEMSRNVGDAIAQVLQGKAKPKQALDLAATQSVGPLRDN